MKRDCKPLMNSCHAPPSRGAGACGTLLLGLGGLYEQVETAANLNETIDAFREVTGSRDEESLVAPDLVELV